MNEFTRRRLQEHLNLLYIGSNILQRLGSNERESGYTDQNIVDSHKYRLNRYIEVKERCL